MNEENNGPEKKIRVLYIFAALPVGGAEEVLVAEVEGLDKNRFTPLVCSLSEKGPVGDQVEKLGIPVFPLHRMKHSRFDYRVITDLCRLMEKERVQVVHTHLYDGGKYGRIAARLARIPCIISTWHNVYVKRRWRYHLINWALAHANDRMVAVSEAVKKTLIRYDGVPARKIQVIYNGIDPAKFAAGADGGEAREKFGIGKHEFLVGVIARLEEQKGHIFLFHALRRILSEGHRLKVILAGEGSLRPSLEEEARSLGLSSTVLFAGTQKPILPVLNALDLFLLPSLWEGFSVAILEAMAAAKPVIATAVGGAAEVITSGEDGILIPPADVPSIASALRDCLLHREKYLDMGSKAHSTVCRMFSRNVHMEKLQALYTEILAGKAGQGAGGP